MPARPAYFHRLTTALEVLRSLSTDWIDRRTVEETLGVSKTVAWRILRHCGAGDGPGNTLVCARADLIAPLEKLQTTGAYEHEIQRRHRLDEALQTLARLGAARRTRIVPDSRALELLNSRFGHLPAGVELTP